MTYFHIRMYTIIGAKSFHCPVRDGKEWDQLAMVVRHNCCRNQDRGLRIEPLAQTLTDAFGRSKRVLIATQSEGAWGVGCRFSPQSSILAPQS